MKYFVVFFFILLSVHLTAQEVEPSQKVSGIVVNDNTNQPLSSVNIINLNKVRGTTTDGNGRFEINVHVNDTLHFTILGFQPLRVRVTNDWIKNKSTRIQLTEKAIALIVNGFSKDVLNKLPMEFAVEAQKLLEISLEGSVG